MKKRAFIKYTEYGKIIPGSMIVTQGSFPSKEGRAKWYEVPTNKCCSPLILTFDFREAANLLVGDASNVNDWNNFFDLPFYGEPFTSVFIFENQVQLFGGKNIVIKEDLFAYNENLIKIIDESGVIVETEESAFEDCKYMSTVKLNGLITAGDRTFDYNRSLTSLTLPNLITAGEYCFYECRILKVMDLPKLQFADYECFYYCLSVTSFNLPELTYADDYAFENCESVETLYLPKLTYAGKRAFDDCDLLRVIDLPKVLYLDDDCFGSSSAMEYINAPLCQNFGSTVGNDGLFEIQGFNPSHTLSINIPQALMTCNGGNPDGDLISAGTNFNLIVNGQPYIPYTGYTGDLTLVWDDIASADALVGDASDVSDWNNFFNLPDWSTPFTGVTVVGNSVTLTGGENIIIGSNLFNGNSNILEVIDTGCVANTGIFTFSYSSLVEVSLQSLLTASDYIFIGCYSLTTANLPSSTKSSEYSFYQCSSLSSINMPNLQIIEDSSFRETSISSINFPNAVFVGYGAFGSCTSVSTIDLINATYIGDFCFFGLNSLTSVNIPSCVNLGENVGDNGIFENISGNTITLTVPSALMTANAGNPDGDIVNLQSDNTVTIVTV